MGTGEPLDNYDNVIRFIRLITDERGYNLSMRNITMSTCGLVPEILRLANEYKNQKILVVTHSHVIKALAVYVDKNKYHFDDPLYNCGLSIFKSDGKIIKIAAFNKKTV